MQFMRIIYPSMKTPLLFLTAMLIFAACDDYSELNNLDKKLDYKNYQYQGSFSLPLGNTVMSLETAGINLPYGWQNFPFELNRLDTIKFEKVINFDFSNTMGDTDKIKYLLFRVIASNEFPAALTFQIYFADAFKVVRTSLSVLEFKVEPAKLDTSGTVKKEGALIQEVELDRDTYRKFGDIKFLILKENIKNDTTQSKYLKFYKNLLINIDLGFRVDFDFNVKNL
jgi:hypothetical protein